MKNFDLGVPESRRSRRISSILGRSGYRSALSVPLALVLGCALNACSDDSTPPKDAAVDAKDGAVTDTKTDAVVDAAPSDAKDGGDAAGGIIGSSGGAGGAGGVKGTGGAAGNGTGGAGGTAGAGGASTGGAGG